jgi:hypothetical protein
MAQLHASIGLALEHRGDRLRAAEEFQQAILLDNSVLTAHDGIGRLNSRYRRLLRAGWRRWGH